MKRSIARRLLCCCIILLIPIQALAQEENGMKNMIQDADFRQGATIISPAKPLRMVGKLPLSDMPDAQSIWLVTQWHSKCNIRTIPLVIEDGAYVYKNEYKTVARDPDGTLTLRVNASEEYSRVRESIQDPWVHLYFEQRFAEPHPIGDAEEMRMQVKFAVPHFRDATPDGKTDPSVHAVIAMVYIILKDMNPESPAFGQYINFCVMLYDNRTGVTPEDWFVDTGYNPQDATQMMIYQMDSSEYVDPVYADGTWHTVDFDPLPFFKKALAISQEQGCMVGSKFEDISVSSVFFGFEMPGMMDCEIKIKDLFLGAR